MTEEESKRSLGTLMRKQSLKVKKSQTLPTKWYKKPNIKIE
jgi:hypothetical protein